MFDSPRPVDPAAPTSLSQYWPAPMIGLSPTRPGTFHEIPLVVVTEPMWPFADTAFMLIVPKVCGTPRSSRNTWLSSPNGADSPRGVGLMVGRRGGALSSG